MEKRDGNSRQREQKGKDLAGKGTQPVWVWEQALLLTPGDKSGKVGRGLRGGQPGRACRLMAGLRGQDGKGVSTGAGDQLDMVEHMDMDMGGMQGWFLGLEGTQEEEQG